MPHMPFKIKEHTADAAFEARGKTLDELFRSAGLAITDITVDPETVEAKEKCTVTVENDDVEMLLYEFLEELIYLKDADLFLVKDIDIDVDGGKATATLKGETIQRDKHDLRNDIKAVTLHKYTVEEAEEGWKAFVIVDI